MMQIHLPEAFDSNTDEIHSVKTTESLSLDPQYMQSACLYCNKSKGLLSQLPTGSLAHVFCRENRPCCICGIPFMCLQCKQPDCSRVFHTFCLKKIHPFLPSSDILTFCDLHSISLIKKKRYLKISSARQIISRIALNESVLRAIKALQGKHKQENVCSGNLLWLNVGMEFFHNPSFLRELPRFDIKEDILQDYPSFQGDHYVEVMISNYEKDLGEIKKEKEKIWATIRVLDGNEFVGSPYDSILSEIKSLRFRECHENYLKFVESKSRLNVIDSNIIETKDPDEVDLLFCENSNNSTIYGEGTKTSCKGKSSCQELEKDYVCEVCGDGDYEDDDLIVICSKCDMSVHTKCYGIISVPDTEWYCKACEENKDPKSLRCPLCPIKGGALKPTINYTTCFDVYPNYNWNGESEKIWVHLYCILNISPFSIGDKASMTNIDISNIDKQKFTLKCINCNTTTGAAIQCQHAKCTVCFHPICIKQKLHSTGYDKDSSFCLKHKPLKLKKLIDTKEKKVMENIFNFIKLYEKYEIRFQKTEPLEIAKKQLKNEKPFSLEERIKLINVIEERLKEEKKKGFSFIFKANQQQKILRCKIEASSPEFFTILDPQIILADQLAIPGRRPEDCMKCYTDLILPVLKKELQVLQYPQKIFKLSSTVKKRLRAEKKTKQRISPFLLTNQPVLNDLISPELHCICRKPFVEAAPIKPGESEEEYNKRLKENEMISCDQCAEWFHLTCINIKSDSIPETFLCSKCNPKRIELCE